MSNERVSDERLVTGLERLTPGWAGSLVAAMGARKNRFKEFGASVGQAEADLEAAVWLADNLPAIRAEIQQRRASGVTPEATEAARDLLASLDPDALNPEQFNAHCALTAALSLVSHETGDGETEAFTFQAPSFWAVWSVSGAHIGTWSDQRIAERVYRDEYPNGELKALYASPLPAPTDETQGVKREPVGYAFTTTDINGDEWVPDFTTSRTKAEDHERRGYIVRPLFSLSQLEAVERPLLAKVQIWKETAEEQEARAETAEASLAAMTAERDAMREALSFYASPDNYIDAVWECDPENMTPKAVPMIQQGDGSTYCDCGDTARAALAGENGR